MPDLPIFTANSQEPRLSPTDVSQFIRLEQCERYLRLRLHERRSGRGFLREYGVAPQEVTPLLTRAGRRFEAEIEAAIRAGCPAVHLAEEAGQSGSRPPDNARVAEAARALPPGKILVLLQPRLAVSLDGWRLTGDADALRLERGADGALRVLVTDIKSSTRVHVEHRLQVAFYHAMLARLLETEGIPCAGIETAVLYADPTGKGAENTPGGEDPAAEARRAAERAAARRLFGLDTALLEVVEDPGAYLESVRDLVTGPESVARRVAGTTFAEIPFHLSYKCDGCLYNEFCMKWCAEQDDLSLIPHLTAGEKTALQRAGIGATRDLACLKEPAPPGSGGPDLVPAPGREALCRRVAVAWPVGPRVDELIYRARRYRRWKGDPIDALPYLPGKGYGSLPYCDAAHDPNLVRVYLDAQHDYLHDRLYLLGARVVGFRDGVPAARRSVVHLADGPPDTEEKERGLLLRWVAELVRAVVECAAPDETGQPRAPIHLIFYNAWEQRLFLQALSRHLSALLGAVPALYDFMTQLAAFDSPIATFLDQEIRELRNYPLVCQSLQAVAAHLRFPWEEGEPFTEIFRARMFDDWRRLSRDDGPAEWYTGRARFNSQIPLEYACAAWGELEAPPPGGEDDFREYRRATPELLRAFQARRLAAMEHIAADFPGNRLTRKKAFDLPELAAFSDRARSLAQALDEFVTIERHVELHAWKMVRHAPPERRVLMGETLLVRYREEDQDPETAERNRENERRRRLREEYEAAFRQANPDAPRVNLPKAQQAETRWSPDGLRVRLRLEPCGGEGEPECSLDDALSLLVLQPGDTFVLCPRWTVDERLPPEERTEFTPTPKQMLYGLRADFVRLEVARDAEGRAVTGWVEVTLRAAFTVANSRGFVFGTFPLRTLEADRVYTLDPCPNSWYGYWCSRVTEGLCALEAPEAENALYGRLADPGAAAAEWPAAAAAGQARFLAGMDALREAGAGHDFEPGKREFIGARGDAPLLLVQGPPGTGKSYSTAFALLARMQGAMAAGRPFRALVSCKTHSATDVLLEKVREARLLLRSWRRQHPALFAAHFDARLLEAPLFRAAPRQPPPEGVVSLPREQDREKGQPKSADALQAPPWCIAAATPGGIYGMVTAKWTAKSLFGHHFCDCLVLDEASQMSLPEAVMAALPLRPSGQLIVVGDHRQMPPIVQHDWESEPRRTFREYAAYQSLFLALLPLAPPLIRFAESFRLHADLAEFLRREVYQQDGIPYHSRQTAVLPARAHADPFLAALLSPEHPLVTVVHAEAASQTRNPFEQALISPLLAALADPEQYGLDAVEGLGVVVPHRAQRAAVRAAFPALCVLDPETGSVTCSAVDTVERFQGGERTVILVSATESDREFVLASSRFLLDPRRLTVALSRAKRKLILVASRSVFSIFSPDEDTFRDSQLWKNLLRRTCTMPLWQGEREGVAVQVWGNRREPGLETETPPAEATGGTPTGKDTPWKA